MRDHVNLKIPVSTYYLFLYGVCALIIAWGFGWKCRDWIESPVLVVPQGAQTNNGVPYCVPNIPSPPLTGCEQPTKP